MGFDIFERISQRAFLFTFNEGGPQNVWQMIVDYCGPNFQAVFGAFYLSYLLLFDLSPLFLIIFENRLKKENKEHSLRATIFVDCANFRILKPNSGYSKLFSFQFNVSGLRCRIA